MRKTHRTTIDDLSAVGQELSEEHVRLASGGMIATGGGVGASGGLLVCATYRGNSSTFNNDIDAYRVD